MARLRLKIGNIAVATEQKTVTIPFTLDDSTEKNYSVSLIDFKLLKKMYSPTEMCRSMW